jgi:hypothetical protein
MSPTLFTSAVLALLWAAGLAAAAEDRQASPWVLAVRSGRSARKETPVRVEFAADRLGSSAAKDLADAPKALRLRELRDGQPVGQPVTAQADRAPGSDGSMVRLTWILPGETPAETVRRFRPESGERLESAPSPWSLSDPKGGSLELKHDGRPVFRYNLTPVSHPQYDPIQQRDAYIHPAFTPSGALITGDYSKYHPHHRGFFLAYANTQVGKLHPDFWNIHKGTGKIAFDRLDETVTGPVIARIVGRHRWEAKGAGTVLRERWEIEVYDIPGSPYWLFDLTTTQQATGEPVELLNYRYGGLAYRGPDSFIKVGEPGIIDVLTSEGFNDRVRAAQKPARWVDLTGPVAEDPSRYGGALLMDHPGNLHFPNKVRIHPRILPFSNYVPAHDAKVTIGTKEPTVFRYRVMIHDGHPDSSRDEQLWRDFAEPPQVMVESSAG